MRDVAFLVKTYFLLYSDGKKKNKDPKFSFSFSLEEKVRKKQAHFWRIGAVCAPAAGVSTQPGWLVAAPGARELAGEGLPARLPVASNPTHHMVCFVCLK